MSEDREWQTTACDPLLACHVHSPVRHSDPRIKLNAVQYVCRSHGGDVRCVVCKRRNHS